MVSACTQCTVPTPNITLLIL